MAETYKEGKDLDELLNAIINIPRAGFQPIKNGSISEYIISGNSGDVKINEMELYSKKYPNSCEFCV